jgi:ABC-2 type transport system permease protein
MMLAIETFFALMRRDMAVFLPTWKDRFINAIIWCVLTLLIFEYIMPQAGLMHYGVFMSIGTAATSGFFEVTDNVSRFIADLEGERSISYYLTLPLPQWAVFVRLALSNALQALCVSSLFLPITKLFLQDRFSLASMSYGKFILVFILAHLFYGFFSLFIAVQVKSLYTMNNVWMRIIYPLWWLGGFQFSWSVLYKTNPYIAYVNLLNPLVWILEGVRGSILGQAGYLPFWTCIAVIVVYTIVVGFIGVRLLLRRLDCV